MNGKFRSRNNGERRFGPPDGEAVAIALFRAIANDPERLGGFLSATGLDPAGLREAARGPGFLVAVLDYVAGDEDLLLALTAEADIPPESVAAAQARLSPVADDSA